VILIVLSYTFSNVYFPGVHEIAYGFGGPSEKNVSPHYPLAKEVAKGYSNATIFPSVCHILVKQVFKQAKSKYHKSYGFGSK
jgi:hypothetical protein